MAGLVERCDHLLEELRLARALPLAEEALEALMVLRLHVAGLRGQARQEAMDAAGVGLAGEGATGALVRPASLHETRAVRVVDFKMCQAGDHSLDVEHREEVPA
jgi:hypothetical protein